jgi:hypothetical protein
MSNLFPDSIIRPFESDSEYRAVIEYFYSADASFLKGMGVDSEKLPNREVWFQTLMSEHEKPDALKNRFYLAWIYRNRQVDHSNINHIHFGD